MLRSHATAPQVLHRGISRSVGGDPFPTIPRVSSSNDGFDMAFPQPQSQACEEHVPLARDSKSVRERAIQRKLNEMHAREQDVTTRQLRHAETMRERGQTKAATMSHDQERSQAWRGILGFVSSMRSMQQSVASVSRRQNLKKVFFPVVLLRVRCWIRRVRERLAFDTVRRPTVADLQGDRVLRLFSEDHQQRVIESAALRYYFNNESITFMNCEEDECFVLASGRLDVMMNGVRVTALDRPGTVFGSVGMISGEPRTATVVGRTTDVFVWVISRAIFERFGDRSADHRSAAEDAVSALRQANLLSVYKLKLAPAALRAGFPSFRVVGEDFLRSFVSTAQPQVCREGTVVCGAALRPSDTEIVLVLRGRVSVYLMRELGSRGMGEQLELTVEGAGLLKKSSAGSDETHEQCLVRTAAGVERSAVASGCGALLGEIEGPVLMGLSAAAQGEAMPLEFRAGARGCDCVRQTRTWLLGFDLLELNALRHAAIDTHCQWMHSLAPDALRRALTMSVELEYSTLDTLFPRSALKALPLQPRVFMPGELVSFNSTTGFQIVFIVAGELESETLPAVPSAGHPVMWPELSVALFSDDATSRRAKTRVEAHCVSKLDLLQSTLLQVEPEELEPLMSALMNRYQEATKMLPRLSIEDGSASLQHGEPMVRERLRHAKELCAKFRSSAMEDLSSPADEPLLMPTRLSHSTTSSRDSPADRSFHSFPNRPQTSQRNIPGALEMQMDMSSSPSLQSRLAPGRSDHVHTVKNTSFSVRVVDVDDELPLPSPPVVDRQTASFMRSAFTSGGSNRSLRSPRDSTASSTGGQGSLSSASELRSSQSFASGSLSNGSVASPRPPTSTSPQGYHRPSPTSTVPSSHHNSRTPHSSRVSGQSLFPPPARVVNAQLSVEYNPKSLYETVFNV